MSLSRSQDKEKSECKGRQGCHLRELQAGLDDSFDGSCQSNVSLTAIDLINPVKYGSCCIYIIG